MISLLERAAGVYAARLAPPPDLSPSQWASENVIVAKGPRRAKLWSFRDGYEYQQGILDQIFGRHKPGELAREADVIKGSQAGITLVMYLGLLFWWISRRMGAALVVPRRPDAAEKAAELAEIIRTSPLIAALCRRANGVVKRGITGEELGVRSTQTDRDLISWGSPVVAMDEVERNGELEYDPRALIEARQGAYEQRILAQLSTPMIPDSGIDAAFQISNRQHYLVRCPFCTKLQALVFEKNIRFPDAGGDEERANRAAFCCSRCGWAWNRAARAEANKLGFWAAERPSVARLGFSVSRLYVPSASPAEFVKGFLEGEADPKKKREFENQKLGRAWLAKGGRASRDQVRALITSEIRWGEPPSSTVKVLAGIDVQGEHAPLSYVVELRAFRADGFCFLFFYDTVQGNDALCELLERRWGGHTIERALLDSSDGDHVREVEKIVFRSGCAAAAKWDNRQEASFRHADLIQGRLGPSGWGVHRELALQDNLSRFFGEGKAPPRIAIAKNPSQGREDELVDHYHALSRVKIERRDGSAFWVFKKASAMGCDYPFAGALAEVGFRIEVSPREVAEEEERIRTEQIEAASPHPTKAQRDRNVSRGKSGGRRWFG